MINRMINTIVSVFLIIVSSLACSQSNLYCPNPKEIKRTAFMSIQKGDTPDVWTLIQKSQYKTPYHWEFSLIVEAKTEKEAIQKSKLALSKLHKLRGPEKSGDALVCDYKAPSAMMATASSKE